MSTVTDTVEKYLAEKYNDSFTFDSYETTAYFTIKKFNRIYRKVQIVKIKVFADTSLLYFGLNEKFNNYNA